jgi:hypothetical protein
MMTLVVEQLRDTGRIRLNGTKEEWAEFAAQFNNIYRERVIVKEAKDKDDKTLYGAEYVWKRSGHDDYVHALLYAVVGMQKYGDAMAKIVDTQGVWGKLPRGIVVDNPVDAEQGSVMLTGDKADF